MWADQSQTTQSPRKTQVLIIGAGLSGLIAAKTLKERNIDFIVLEARDRVGGRTYTVEDPVHGWVDLGASYVGPTQDHILKLAKELQVETYPVYFQDEAIHFTKGKRYIYSTQWPNFNWKNPLATMDIYHTCNLLDEMIKEVIYIALTAHVVIFPIFAPNFSYKQ